MKKIYINNNKITLWNVISSIISQSVYIIYNFIMLPLIVSVYGSATNGIVQTFIQIISYVQLVGAGISESALVSLYKPVKNSEEDEINNILNACSKLFIRSGVLYIIIVIAISFIYPLFLNEEIGYINLVFLMLTLSIVGMCEFFLYGKYRTFLIAAHRLYIINVIQVLTLLLALIFGIMLIHLNSSILVVQLAISLCFIVRSALAFFYCKVNFSFLSKVSSRVFVIKDRKDVLVHQFASLIMNASQLPLISVIMGSVYASVFSIYILIYSGISILIRTLCNAFMSNLGYLSEDKDKLPCFFIKYQFWMFVIIFSVFNTALILGDGFIFLYTRDISDVNYLVHNLNLLFVIMALLNCLKLPGIVLISALGHYNQTKSRAIIELLICLLLEVVLIPIYGLEGAVVACIFAYLYRLIDVLWYISKCFFSRNYIFLLYIALGFLFVFLVFFIIGDVKLVSYYDFVYCGIVYFSLSILIFFSLFYIIARLTKMKIGDIII